MFTQPSNQDLTPDTWRRGIQIGFGLALAVAVIVLAFSWPSVTAEPRDLPVAVAGPAPQVDAATSAIEQNSDGAIELVDVADRDAAVTAIEEREAYGAIVIGQQPEVLTSSAASPVVSQMLTAMAGQLQQQMAQSGMAGVTVEVTDVVPLLDADSRGSGLTAAALPLVIGGMLGGIAMSLLITGVRQRVTALLVYAAVAGVAIAAVLQSWFGVLDGSFALNAGAFALSLLAIGSTIVGFAAVVGPRGIAIGPVLFLLIANPISGAAFPKEFLPASMGEVGQWFPPGAGATLIRNLSYFPDANSLFPTLVLVGWCVFGLLLASIGHARTTRRPQVITAHEEREPAEPVAV